ncbi:MAG: 3-keto-5-aminohexanoate cleavage protein [Sulfuritalea sp.]|nr:3-keto-5-aminohexanoate cleavage protein [Sulfuritalea sp.]
MLLPLSRARTHGSTDCQSCPNGLVPTRAQSPHVPLNAEEVAADCALCRAAGASMLHLHARAADGSPSCDRAVFGELVAAVRGARAGCDHRHHDQWRRAPSWACAPPA